MNQKLLFCINLVVLATIDLKGLFAGVFVIAVTFIAGKTLEKIRSKYQPSSLYFTILALFYLSLFSYKFLIAEGRILSFFFLSYILLQCTGYLLEISKGAVQLKFLELLNCNLLFIKAVAGPVERPHEFKHELEKMRLFPHITTENFSLLIMGFLKISLAGNFYLLFDALKSHDSTGLTSWTEGLFSIVHIYCDFSGYTDITIAVASMWGIALTPNFNTPFRAYSLSDFWNRWHISLTSWFRDYVYAPTISLLSEKNILKSSNVKVFAFLSTFLTFLGVGIWHSVSWKFLLWSMLNSLFIVYPAKYLKHVTTLVLIIILNVLALYANNVQTFVQTLKSMIFLANTKLSLPVLCLFIYVFLLIVYLDFSETHIRKKESRNLRIAFMVLNILLLALIINPSSAVIYGKF